MNLSQQAKEALDKEIQEAHALRARALADGTLFSLTTSSLAHRMAPPIRVQKAKGPVTRDCHAVHMHNWCGGATPRRPGAE